MSLFPEGSQERFLVISRYESMLSQNQNAFFDTHEFEEIIHYYLENGKFAKAKQAVQRALEQHPKATELLLLQVEIFIFEDNLSQAEYILNKIIELEPFNSEVYVQKANLFSKKGNHLKAIQLLEKALSFSNDTADIYSLIAMEFLYSEQYDLAKKYFKKCIENDPEDYFSLQQLLHCYDFLEEHQLAIDFLTQYLDNNPYCEVAWHSLGRQYLAQNNLTEALKAFNYATISDDTFTGAYFEKGKVLEQLGRYAEAIENYKITLTLDDPSSYAYLRIGKCFEKLGEFPLAEQNFFKAVYEDPQSSKAWMTIVTFYAQQNDLQKAIKYIPKVLLNENDDFLYWRECAEIYFKAHQKEKGIATLKKAIELGDTEQNIFQALVFRLLLWKEYQQVISCGTQAIQYHPNQGSFYFQVGIAHFFLKNIEQCISFLEKGIEKNKQHLSYFDKQFPMVFQNEQIRKALQQKLKK